MKKVLAVFLCLASLFFSTTAYAAQTAEIYADDMVVSEGETIIFPVNIKNNKGIMGFKLTFTYDTSCFNVVTVDRGELTENGNFNDNLNKQKGTFDVIWNDSEERKGDESILFLQVEVIKLEGGQEIAVSYSKEDTFNESWQDVDITCTPIRFLPSDTNTTKVTTTTQSTQKSEEESDEESNDSAYIKTAVDAAKKQAQIDKLSDLADGEKDAFIESVNFYLSAFTGTVENNLDTIEEIRESYNESLADRFIQSALECIDTDVIIEVIESVLDEKGVNSIGKISEENQKAFADAVYLKLKEKSEDISVLPEDTATAYDAVKSLYEQAKQIESPFNWKLFAIIAVSAVVLIVITIAVYRSKKRKKKMN